MEKDPEVKLIPLGELVAAQQADEIIAPVLKLMALDRTGKVELKELRKESGVLAK